MAKRRFSVRIRSSFRPAVSASAISKASSSGEGPMVRKTRRWRGTDTNFRFPERSVSGKGAPVGDHGSSSSFVSLPYGYPATACVGIKPEEPKPLA